MYIAEMVLRGQSLSSLASLIKIRPPKQNLRPHPPHRSNFKRVGVFRHYDTRLDAEDLRGVSDRLPVIAGGCGYDPTTAFVWSKLRYQIDSAAHLESADRLKVLMLDQNPRAGKLI